MNEESNWDHNVEGDATEGPVDCVIEMWYYRYAKLTHVVSAACQ